MRQVALAAILILSAPTGVAFAQQRPPSSDMDRDGIVTLAEHQAVSESRFFRMDANRDGMIDKAEQKRVTQFLGGRNPLAPADLNRDGRVSKSEFTTAVSFLFSRADQNKDGRLSASEQKAMRSSQAR